MNTPDPLEIVRTPETAAVLTKGFYYLVRLEAEHYQDDIELYPAFMGYHVGTWDGETLVIDTLGTNPYTWLDATGLPHGYSLHTVQRIRRTADGGLENVITIEDEEFFTQPWNVRLVYESQPYVSLATDSHPCDRREGVAP
jgi:hypothetical protein